MQPITLDQSFALTGKTFRNENEESQWLFPEPQSGCRHIKIKTDRDLSPYNELVFYPTTKSGKVIICRYYKFEKTSKIYGLVDIKVLKQFFDFHITMSELWKSCEVIVYYPRLNIIYQCTYDEIADKVKEHNG